MAALEFPENPVLNQTYDFPPFQYIWDGVKWKTVGRGADTVAEAINAHKSAVDQHSIAGVAGLQTALDNLAKNSGDPVLSAKWVQKRSAMWTGYAAGDGQELSRALYPDAWAAINAGLVPVCTKAEWIADPAKRGCFHTGDGATTFGLPDYNGVYSGSYGPVYLGGGVTDGGAILRDRVGKHRHAMAFQTTIADSEYPTGAKPIQLPQSGNVSWAANNSTSGRYVSTFDGTAEGFTGDTTRPITAEGCIAIKLFGAVQNTGSADAAALATAVATLAARVTALEARKSTCLVNATGTGAPHETVSAALPANIALNSRYVLPNPFGVNVKVAAEVEIQVSGEWINPGWNYDGGGTGVRASGKPGEGVIVRTSNVALAGNPVQTGGNHSASLNVTSAPCRVFIRRIDD